MTVDFTVYVKQQHNNNIIPMTTFFSVTAIVVYLPERTNTGLLTGSEQTVRTVRSCNNWLWILNHNCNVIYEGQIDHISNLYPLSVKHGFPTKPNIPFPKRSTTLTRTPWHVQCTYFSQQLTRIRKPNQAKLLVLLSSALRSQSYQKVFCSFRPNRWEI